MEDATHITNGEDRTSEICAIGDLGLRACNVATYPRGNSQNCRNEKYGTEKGGVEEHSYVIAGTVETMGDIPRAFVPIPLHPRDTFETSAQECTDTSLAGLINHDNQYRLQV